MMLTMNGLLNKVATAEEEWDEMPLDKAGRLIASLSRTKVYKDRVKQDMRKKADIAFQELEADMMKVIKQDEESVRMLKTILTKAKDRMMQDD
jgi:predicted RNase H-like nuclease